MSIWLSIGAAGLVGFLAEQIGWLRKNAFWAAAIVGGVPTWKFGLTGAVAVVAFVVVGSLLSRLNPKGRDSRGRTALQVLANGLPAVLGCLSGNPSFFLGSLAAAMADTAASEIGVGAKSAWHPLRGRVPSGTNGAISLRGSIALVLGAGIYGGFAWLLSVPPVAIILGGIVGAVVDTILGIPEDKYDWWTNDLTNFLCCSSGGLVALLLGRLL